MIITLIRLKFIKIASMSTLILATPQYLSVFSLARLHDFFGSFVMLTVAQHLCIHPIDSNIG